MSTTLYVVCWVLLHTNSSSCAPPMELAKAQVVMTYVAESKGADQIVIRPSALGGVAGNAKGVQ